MKTTRRNCVLFFVCWEIAQSSIKKKRATFSGPKALLSTKPVSWKGSEQPAWAVRPYTTQNPLLEFMICGGREKVKGKMS